MLVLGASLLLTAGCGSSGAGSGGSSQSAVSTQQSPASHTVSAPAAGPPAANAKLIAEAEPICAALNTALATAAPVGLDARKIAAGAPAHVLLERRAVEELSRLRAPAAMAGDWRQIIAYRRTLASELAQLARVAKAGDSASIGALAVSKRKVRLQLLGLATRDGFTACTRVG